MQDLSRIISAGTGPIIVISACGLLCLAFYNRLSGLVARLRLFHRERLNEQEKLGRRRAGGHDPTTLAAHEEMLQALEVQTTHIMNRAHLIRQALSCFLLTIACLSLCSLLLGTSVLWPALIIPSVLLFIFGMALLVIGVLIAMRELYRSLQPVELESSVIAEIAGTIDKISG